MIPLVALELPLSNTSLIDYGLINASNARGLSGYHYSDNHFGGHADSVLETGITLVLFKVVCIQTADVCSLIAPLELIQMTERDRLYLTPGILIFMKAPLKSFAIPSDRL